MRPRSAHVGDRLCMDMKWLQRQQDVGVAHKCRGRAWCFGWGADGRPVDGVRVAPDVGYERECEGGHGGGLRVEDGGLWVYGT